jgi:hypothetical protein
VVFISSVRFPYTSLSHFVQYWTLAQPCSLSRTGPHASRPRAPACFYLFAPAAARLRLSIAQSFNGTMSGLCSNAVVCSSVISL